MEATQSEQTSATKPKGGAPKGNSNRTKHGLTGSKLPAGCAYIEHRTNQFRRQLEVETLSLRGAVAIYDAALIQSATRHETRAKLLQRWLRISNGDLTILERAQLLREISNASDSRDKCLEKLKLDQARDVDPWKDLYSQPIPAAVPQATETTQDDGSITVTDQNPAESESTNLNPVTETKP